MKSRQIQVSAAALALAICLTSTPAVYAGDRGDRDFGGKVVRVIKKLQKLLGGGIASNSDLPTPPKP